uniref:Ig-like domain-containing protein n=1 Tax=Anabas testudineus TaxID=64144 RepID=A0A3Q1JR53_ANATE
MRVYNFIFCQIFCLLSSVFTYENFAQVEGCCIFNGQDSLKDVEYIIENKFNRKLTIEYNSTRGNWTGFTPLAIEKANGWNSDPDDAILRAFEKKILCTDNKDFVRITGVLTSVPTIKIKSVQQSNGRDPAMLVCTAYNFYPKKILVTWLRNDQEVMSGVSCSDVLPDGNWYYQVHSYLEYIPFPPEKITCMVEHLSLSEPVLHVWDPSLPMPERIKIALGLCGLVLGFVIVSTGFFYYKKESAAYIAHCQGQVLISVEDLAVAGAT